MSKREHFCGTIDIRLFNIACVQPTPVIYYLGKVKRHKTEIILMRHVKTFFSVYNQYKIHEPINEY